MADAATPTGSAKVRVELDLCVGHGRCYELAPQVFGEDERGYCRILVEHVSGELLRLARLGEHNCPEGAIFVDEE